MGSSYHKDEKVEIFMDINREYYVAGQEVHGCAYLDVKEQRSYSCMQILVNGQEYVYWSEGSGKNRRSYSNRHHSYENSFTLHNFQGTVPQGQYAFPFTFVLPSMMCGSFTYSSSCYIQYTCTARLTHLQMKKSQIYAMHLNIMEPPRVPLGAISITNNVHSQCCGCCASYGETAVTMNCNKNFMITGDNFSVNGVIDHSRGKQIIKTGRVMLEQRRIMISSGGRTRYHLDYSHPLYGINRPINPGETYNFQFESTFPTVNGYTAIGRVTARYFVIHLYTQYGCCANTAYATLHVIAHSTAPLFMVNQKRPKPASWYPQEFPLVICNQMKPYTYSPLNQIPFLNLPGQNQEVYVNQPNQYQNYQPSYGNYQEPQYQYLQNDMSGGAMGKEPYFNNNNNGPVKYT